MQHSELLACLKYLLEAKNKQLNMCIYMSYHLFFFFAYVEFDEFPKWKMIKWMEEH